MEKSFEIRPIGKVISPISNTGEMPLQGVAAQVKIMPEYAEALSGIDDHTHIFLLCWMDRSNRDRLKVIPRRHGRGHRERGVFALRSPVRPNPIALCPTRLLKRQGNLLYLDRLDMVDGTPVIDIKPYSTGWDCIFSARNNSTYDVYSKMPTADVLADMLRQAGNFHGDCCVGVAIGVRAAYLALNHFQRNLQDKSFVIQADVRGCIADALQSLFSSGNKRFNHGEAADRIVFNQDGRRLEITITKKKFHSVDEVLAASDEELFTVKTGG